MQIRIIRLEKDHDRSAFYCGDDELDNYLRLFAWQNQAKHLIGTTYVAAEVHDPYTVVGYYTLAAAAIPSYYEVEMPALRNLPYSNLPAVLLARLGVAKRLQNRGLGRHLLGDTVKRSLSLTEVIGCRCLVVDAYPSAVRWYRQFGFIELGSGPAGSRTRRMLLDLRTAAVAAKSAIPAIPLGENRSTK